MKTVIWIVKLLLFFVALTFAVKNTDSVTVRYYLGAEWQAPLIFVILVVFCLGAAAGAIVSLAPVIRLRREVSRLRKQVSSPSAAVAKTDVDAPSRAAASNMPDVI
jgi:lipopolysaccharide assembly protein A